MAWSTQLSGKGYRYYWEHNKLAENVEADHRSDADKQESMSPQGQCTHAGFQLCWPPSTLWKRDAEKHAALQTEWTLKSYRPSPSGKNETIKQIFPRRDVLSQGICSHILLSWWAAEGQWLFLKTFFQKVEGSHCKFCLNLPHPSLKYALSAQVWWDQMTRSI